MLGKNLLCIDSMQFMNLKNLVQNSQKIKFNDLSQEFNEKQLELVKQKEYYPYEYMNNFERFDERKLPNKEHFYSTLNEKHISDKGHEHALRIWNEFEMKNMGKYHDLYLKIDALSLADVFEEFRNICI